MGQDIGPWRPLPHCRFLIGICHFPEQEPREQISDDARLMAEAGIETVRMGEFAWSVVEPEEGRFDFSLFDEAIAVLGAHGIDTIFCTPTATPPRWLSHRHPGILRVDGDGRSQRHGSRQHADVTSPLFRDHSRRITRALADHYRGNRHVIGWQTDNEFNTHFSETHSDAAQAAFRLWLRARYRDIGALNAAWGTVFWNRQYGDFGEIETPVNNRPASADPSHLLDYRRFLADATRDFQREQLAILRAANPDWFLFHNIGRLNDTDLRDFGADLDFLGTDVYPGLRDEYLKAGLGYSQAMQLDSFRGWSGNFIIPELQLGSGAHPGFAIPAPEPGELRRFAFSSVARGADGILWFRWTSARYGAEAYWMGALDHDRVPRRRYAELKETIADLKAVRGDILGTSVDANVAILAADWENEIAQASFSLGLPSLAELSLPLHHHCYQRNIVCSFAAPGDDLARAKIAFVPHLALWDARWTDNLTAFVEAGGIIVVGARTATRNENNHVLETAAPGALRGLCGVSVREFGRLPAPGASSLLSGAVFQVEALQSGRVAESAKREHFIELGGAEIRAAHGYEIVDPAPGTEVIGRWASRFLAGEAAITRRRLGAGQVIYVGTYLTPGLAASLFDPLFAQAGIHPPALPPGVEQVCRSGPSGTYRFLQNTGAEARTVASPDGDIDLAPYGCMIVRMPR
ncbi:beta-galactosidase [Sphingopyxis sp.]|jgi:beta-galactosidase|uniref:beta-galactosidase n=1 Tax=Sphingopyxis sp. TaxID=1908224 RepID=UPI002DE5B4FF|nr:beta-galactosidase [Sphingopyxis sp.]